MRSGQISAFGATEQINGIAPTTFASLYRFKWAAGSSLGALPALGDSGALITSDFATAHHLGVGSRFTAQTQSSVTLDLTVRAIHKIPTLSPLLGAVTISTRLFDHSFLQPDDAVGLADTGGANGNAQRLLTGLLAGFPTAKVRTVDGYIETEATINTLLNLFYVLLALSVIISLFGIVNTLALSIVARTREIGALRAIGMTRRQLRRMIRVESEITAMIGAPSASSSDSRSPRSPPPHCPAGASPSACPCQHCLAGSRRLLRRHRRRHPPSPPGRPPRPSTRTPMRVVVPQLHRGHLGP